MYIRLDNFLAIKTTNDRSYPPLRDDLSGDVQFNRMCTQNVRDETKV